MATTTQGQQVETLPSHNNFPRTAAKRFTRQYSVGSIPPALTQHISYSSQQQHKGLSLVGDILKLKRHSWHFTITHYLKIQKASNSRHAGSLGKDPGQEQSVPFLFHAFLWVAPTSLWEMCSEDKKVIRHYCLTTWPMVFPKISSSGKSSHCSRSPFIPSGAQALFKATATFTSLTCLCFTAQIRAHSSIWGPFQTVRPL